jgi:hypothetical protein
MRRLCGLICAAVLCVVCFSGCGRAKPGSADLFNEQAELKGPLPYPIWRWKVLSTGVDRGAGTMYTLFGNEVAVMTARSGQSYPVGSVLAAVTWRQRDDPHWFGGRISGDPVSVEFVTVNAGTPGSGVYQRFTGSPLRADTSAPPAGRMQEILSEKAVMLP